MFPDPFSNIILHVCENAFALIKLYSEFLNARLPSGQYLRKDMHGCTLSVWLCVEQAVPPLAHIDLALSIFLLRNLSKIHRIPYNQRRNYCTWGEADASGRQVGSGATESNQNDLFNLLFNLDKQNFITIKKSIIFTSFFLMHCRLWLLPGSWSAKTVDLL